MLRCDHGAARANLGLDNYVANAGSGRSKTLSLPHTAVQGYWLIIGLWVALGPWPWPIANPWKLYGFITVVQVSFGLGYWLGLRVLPECGTPRIGARQWHFLSLVCWGLLLLPLLVARTGGQPIDLMQVPSLLARGVADPGSAYTDRQAAFQALQFGVGRAGYWTSVALLLGAPSLWMLLPVTIVFWSRLGLWRKWLAAVFLLVDAASWLLLGTVKGIADAALLLPALVFARSASSSPRSGGRQWRRLFFLTGLGIVALYSWFSWALAGRQGGQLADSDVVVGIDLNRGHWSVALLTDAGARGVGALSHYLTQGYYGLSLALDMPQEWCYGLGNSYFSMNIAERLFGIDDIIARTLAQKAEEASGWGAYARWSSLYPWLANDVGFAGVPVVMFFGGAIFSRTWKSFVQRRCPVALSLWCLLLVAWAYAPANNQVLHFSGTFVAFWVLLVAWLVPLVLTNWGHPTLRSCRPAPGPR